MVIYFRRRLWRRGHGGWKIKMDHGSKNLAQSRVITMDNKKPCLSQIIFRFSSILILCITLWSSWVSCAQANDTASVTGSVVNIRSAPDNTSSIIGTLASDTRVEITGSNDSWFEIKYGQLNGWIAQSLVKVNLPSETVSSAKANSAPTNETIQVINGPINARSGPGSNYDKTALLPDQATYLVVAETEGWYQIRLENGATAYVAGWLVKEIGSGNNQAGDQEVIGAAVPVTAVGSAQLNTSPVSSSATPVVLLNGQAMQFEVNPIIENGRTLVPLRAIFEALGARVEWDAKTSTVTAAKDSTIIILPLNSTQPTVNNIIHPLDVPAKIVGGRTLVPLRFVGEVLGGSVVWDDKTRTINITSSTPATVSRVMVTETQVNLREGPAVTFSKLDVARSGEYLAVIGEKDGWYQVSRGSMSPWIAGWCVQPVNGESVTNPTDSTKPQNNSGLSDGSDLIALSAGLGTDGYRLSMKTINSTEPAITTQDNKVIYTFKGFKLRDTNTNSLTLGNSTNIRIPVSAQTANDTTQVVIELPVPYQYIRKTEENGCKQVFLIPPQLVNIGENQLANGNQVINIYSTGKMQYQDNSQSGMLTVNLPGTCRGSSQASYTLGGAAASQVQVTGDAGRSTSISIILKQELQSYYITSNNRGDMLSIILVSQGKSTAASQKRINVMLDPGHGGRDSGVHRSLNEKDVTLSIALKAKAILERSENINPVMTRDEDIALGPDETADIRARSALANQLPADLFISIHCNGVAADDPRGTETYFYISADNPQSMAQEFERSLLAGLCQKMMIQKLGLNNRGVKENNLGVLRQSNMPSALVEVGFISNVTEESLLGTDSCQQLAAEAIAEAVKEYIALML